MSPFSAEIPLDAVRQAAQRPEVISAMRAFYATADREIAEKQPTCWNRGECCRFGEYGHRLYVTSLEVAYYLSGLDATRLRSGTLDHAEAPDDANDKAAVRLPILGSVSGLTDDACPHAFEGECHAREVRPTGCRIFFCDPDARAWQGPMTEEALSRLRAMHDAFGVPYAYSDWMDVMRAVHGE